MSQWLELFPQFPESIWKVSQGILIAFSDDARHSLRSSGVTLQQQALRPSSSYGEALKLPGHRRNGGHLVTGLLQSPVSGSQTRRIIQTYHRHQEMKSITGNTFVQDGSSFLNNSSYAATRMDHQDRPKRRLSSYPCSCENSEVISLCYSWKDLSVLV